MSKTATLLGLVGLTLISSSIEASLLEDFQMLRHSFLMASLVGFLAVPILLSQATDAAAPETSHKQARNIEPELDGERLQLNTFGMGPDGNLWLCCTDTKSEGRGTLLIKSPTGEDVRHVAFDFTPTAINFSTQGIPFVAGAGKVARLTKEGQVDLLIDAPNLLNEEELKKRMEESAQKQIDKMVATYETQVTRLDEQLAKLKAQAEDESADEKIRKRAEARVKVIEQQRDIMKDQSKQIRETYKQYFNGAASMERVKRATGLAVSERDVFVSLPSLEGFGYGIWRMDHELKNAVAIKEGVGGCCGQLDIQTDGTDLLIAENTAFKVGRFDRDGKSLTSFGERMREGNSGWGSCCNPMNIRCVNSDEILTAESSIGHIKRYSKDGKYLGLIGTARIGGGCKHVALAVDKKRDWYYMMNQGGNNIAVLVPKSEAPAETEEEKQARIAREGLGKKLVGAWEAVKDQDKYAPVENTNSRATIDSMIQEQFKYLHFHLDGHFENTRPTPTSSNSSSTGGLFGALQSIVQSVTGSQISGTGEAQETQTWEPIQQKDDKLEFSIVSSGVRGYGATARILEGGELQLSWYYDSPGYSYGTMTYKKVEGDCCSEDKPCATCTGKCETKSTAVPANEQATSKQ